MVVNPFGNDTLEARNLSKAYGGRYVVNGVTLKVSSGEVVGLLGPNGAGKTTTFYIIMGLVNPDGGEVYLAGEEVTALSLHRRARKGVGYLAQEPSVFRGLSVEDNLFAVLEYQKMSRQNTHQLVDQLLDDLGLTHLRKQKAFTLSGGEKRRCEIARALATEPKFLLLDEPFVGIDPITVTDIQGIIKRLKSRGLGLLITDHNVRATLEIVDRAALLYDGKILTYGHAQKLMEDPEARRLYLGENFSL